MSINQTYRQSDLEKRLKILRRQIYGKESVSNIPSKAKLTKDGKYQVSGDINPEVAATSNTDIIYLRADLTKISLLAGTALVLEVILYFLIKNNLLNLNLF